MVADYALGLCCKAVCNSGYGFAGPWLELIEILSKRPKLFYSVRAMVQAQHVQPYKTLVYMDIARGQNRLYPRFFPAEYGPYPRVYCRTGRKTPQTATAFQSLVPSMRVLLRVRGFA
jgi:hypothetical protein